MACRRALKAVLIDLSGTLHIEDVAVPGAQEALNRSGQALANYSLCVPWQSMLAKLEKIIAVCHDNTLASKTDRGRSSSSSNHKFSTHPIIIFSYYDFRWPVRKMDMQTGFRVLFCFCSCRLRQAPLAIKFVTNTTKESKRNLLARLQRLHFDVQVGCLIGNHRNANMKTTNLLWLSLRSCLCFFMELRLTAIVWLKLTMP